MRYPIRIHDADELGWMEARGELRAYAIELRRRRRRYVAGAIMLIGMMLVAIITIARADAVVVAETVEAVPLAARLPALCGVAPAVVSGVRTTVPGTDLLPADPFQRCAVKALRGDFGTLADWQRRGYQAGLAAGVTVQGTATVTTYYPQEGFPRGQAMRSGVGVNERYAACLRNEWPRLRGSYVWAQPTMNSQGRLVGGIRQIMDTGANSNHKRFGTRMGSDRWLDYWYPTPTELVRRVPYAIWEAQ